MSEPVRWGILSTARINDKVLAGAREAAGFSVLAVASRDAARARAWAAEREIPRAYGSYEELLADPDVEAVYNPLPNALHVPWTLRALQAGKHVLCEKPFARTAAEAERAYALAAERGLLLSEAFMYRHHPQIARLLSLVAEGAVGRLRLVRAQFSFPLAEASDVRLSAALEGGALMDVGCYCLHAARTLAGEPSAFAAVQEHGGDGVDVRFAAALRFPDGVLAHFDAGLDCAERDELEVVGEAGTLWLDDPWHGVRPGISLVRGGAVQEIAVPAANPYRCQAENLCAAIRGEAELLLGAADGVAQARAIEALYAAAG
jgi:xylose dehydrogenase (NAD/NADP)